MKNADTLIINSATTADWLTASREMKLSAYDPRGLQSTICLVAANSPGNGEAISSSSLTVSSK